MSTKKRIQAVLESTQPEPMPIGITMYVWLDEPIQNAIAAVGKSSGDGDWGPGSEREAWEALEAALGKIQYVTEVGIEGHVNYMKIDPESGDFNEAAQRWAKIQMQSLAIIARWAKKL